MTDPMRNLGPSSAHHRDTPRGLPGAPTLFGPYVADHTELAHDGDTKELWTPQQGDILLKLFTDLGTVVQWDQGALSVRYKFVASPASGWVLTAATSPQIGGGFGGLDFESEGVNGSQRHAAAFAGTTGFVFDTPDPVVLYYDALGSGTAPRQGRVALYALIARAAAP